MNALPLGTSTDSCIEQAKLALKSKGEALDPPAVCAIVECLKNDKDWWWARRVLEAARKQASSSDLGWIRQQLALCTYKDPDLRREAALARALDALGVVGAQPADVDDAETAGLAGSIHKRRWEVDGQLSHLYASLAWYRRAAELKLEPFDPYGAINVAFVADLIAAETERSGADPRLVVPLRDEATTSRELVVTKLTSGEQPWWQTASLIEALVGLGQAEAALALLEETGLDQCAGWELESLARQLAALRGARPSTDFDGAVVKLVARISGLPPSATTCSALDQRFGVALSGGGFRAALVHLGVLARFADLGLLRHVEALSCVSGGSIAGTAYYLAFADLLESSDDTSITDDDLADVVAKCIGQFERTLTRNNIRSRAFLLPSAILHSALNREWSRTNETGRLIERYLFRPLVCTKRSTARLSDLKVNPRGTRDFNPKRNNWNRLTKVPILILNATSIGTGRTWQFTASWMGEPPAGRKREADSTERLERIWLDRDPPQRALAVTIADAVASSACVPGLFPPLTFDGLYDEWSVRLVDGGVRDNQGIGGLLDQECTEIFISDAGGLLGTKKKPWRLLPAVVKRVGSVSRAAIRTTAFAELMERTLAGSLRAARFVYLLEGVPGTVIPPTGTPTDESGPIDAEREMPKDIQKALAKIRTDLDRFSIAEIYALMYRGYSLARSELERDPHPLATEERVRAWDFFSIEPLFASSHPLHSTLLGELRAGRRRFFRWATYPAWKRIARERTSRRRHAAANAPDGSAIDHVLAVSRLPGDGDPRAASRARRRCHTASRSLRCGHANEKEHPWFSGSQCSASAVVVVGAFSETIGLSTIDGQIRWRGEGTPVAVTESYAVLATPTVGLTAHDVTTGVELWTRPLPALFGSPVFDARRLR